VKPVTAEGTEGLPAIFLAPAESPPQEPLPTQETVDALFTAGPASWQKDEESGNGLVGHLAGWLTALSSLAFVQGLPPRADERRSLSAWGPR
jgi:hypothetical protein